MDVIDQLWTIGKSLFGTEVRNTIVAKYTEGGFSELNLETSVNLFKGVAESKIYRLKEIIFAGIEIPENKKVDVDEWWDLIDVVEDSQTFHM